MSKSISTQKYKLTEGPVGVQLITLTLPMIWGVFAVIAFSLADTYFVGQLGTTELAAMGFTFPVVTVFGSMAMGLGTGASSVIARAIGSGDRYRVQQLTTNSLTLSLLIVGIFLAIGLATIDPLFKQLGASSEVLPFIREYMEIWYWGMIFLVVPMVGNSAIRAAGDTKIPSLIMILAGAVNIVLDPVFILGWGFVPSLGLRGAAIATVLSRSITLIASLIVLHFRERMILWSVSCLRGCWNCWKEILSVGLPAAATSVITPFSIGIITSLLAVYGPEAVAGFGISSRIESFSLIILLALSSTIGPFVGQNWGAKQYGRVRQALKLSALFCIAWGILIAVILAAVAPQIVAIFDPNPEVLQTAVRYLMIVPISYGMQGLFLVSSSAFNALGRPIPSVILTLSRMVVLYVPLAYLSSLWFGMNGIFAAACLANFVVGIWAILWSWKACRLSAEPVLEKSEIMSVNNSAVSLSKVKDTHP